VFSPSLVPKADDTVYIVEDDFGTIGRSYRETDASRADRLTTLNDLYSGQYNDPVRVIAFNTREGWARDVSYELASELQRGADVLRVSSRFGWHKAFATALLRRRAACRSCRFVFKLVDALQGKTQSVGRIRGDLRLPVSFSDAPLDLRFGERNGLPQRQEAFVFFLEIADHGFHLSS
jgi:hypothetical protein